jgi:hypothetical protein
MQWTHCKVYSYMHGFHHTVCKFCAHLMPTLSVHLYFVVVADQEKFTGISLDLIIVQLTTIIFGVAIHWTPDFLFYLSSIESGIHIVFS